jgi:hypothetical protein
MALLPDEFEWEEGNVSTTKGEVHAGHVMS